MERGHVLRVVYLYVLGLKYHLLSTRLTNAIDVEYLFYLPFCMVFSSGDNFVIQMSKVIIGAEQFFVDRETLKRDMKAVSAYYNTKDEAVRAALVAEYKAGRPEGVFKHPLWCAMNQPPWERKRQALSPEQELQSRRRAAEIMKALQAARQQKR